jgi:glucokinase
MRVVPGGRLCGCGNRGCLEQYCSGTALVRAARELAVERPADAVRLLELAGGDLAAVDGPVVTKAAQEGDPAAVDCFDEIGRWLGQGLADISALLDPGRYVIGGGVAEAGDLLLSAGRETFAAVITGRGYRPLADVVQATLGEKAGLIGAADLARLS